MARDFECYGTTGPAGSAVLLLFGAANRDPGARRVAQPLAGVGHRLRDGTALTDLDRARLGAAAHRIALRRLRIHAGSGASHATVPETQ